MKTIGERIRELREGKDISLREIASKIKVSAAFMSDVELGQRQPSDKHLIALARILRTPLKELKQYDTRPPLKEVRRKATASPEYGYALRRIVNDSKITSRELLKFLDEREQAGKKGGKPKA